MTQIWVPGYGRVNSDIVKVDRKVNEYNERLSFKQNPHNGQFCVFMSMPHGHDPPEIPVLGFEGIPSPDAAIARLYEADTLRHGEAIFDRIVRRNAEIKAYYDEKAKEATGQLAEAIEVAHRKKGTHPKPRVFVSGLNKEDNTDDVAA